jgi:predicted DNA-binding protein
MEAFCLHCRQSTPIEAPRLVGQRGRNARLEGRCGACGGRVVTFVALRAARTTHVRCSPESAERLTQVARATGCTVADLVDVLVTRHLDAVAQDLLRERLRQGDIGLAEYATRRWALDSGDALPLLQRLLRVLLPPG